MSQKLDPKSPIHQAQNEYAQDIVRAKTRDSVTIHPPVIGIVFSAEDEEALKETRGRALPRYDYSKAIPIKHTTGPAREPLPLHHYLRV